MLFSIVNSLLSRNHIDHRVHTSLAYLHPLRSFHLNLFGGRMHKKKASLIPLNYDYPISSEQDEVNGEKAPYDVILTPHPGSAPPSGISARKTPTSRPDSPPCACNSTTFPVNGAFLRAASGSLTTTTITNNNNATAITSSSTTSSSSTATTTTSMLLQGDDKNATNTNQDMNRSIPTTASTSANTTTTNPNTNTNTNTILFAVDGHRASVTLTPTDIMINYKSTPSVPCCCLPLPSPHTQENIPLSEILSAQPLPPVVTKWLWHPFPETTYRLAVYTFRRAPRNPSHWVPRCVILSTPAEGVVQLWAAAINTATSTQFLRRPRQLLVLINPYGGKRQGVDVYNTHVAPVLERAGIKTVVKRTQFGGHARSLILDMPSSELDMFDGVLAVGGDGLFHEIVNGLLALRTMAAVKRSSTTTTTTTSIEVDKDIDNMGIHKDIDDSTSNALDQTIHNVSKEEAGRRAVAAASMRVGHIPAGSTDAVACTLNGTRNAFSAAMRIALGDGVPLDVLRIDAADGTTEFATCMASYGFLGDVMVESEGWRWMGPWRYEVVGAKMLAANRSYHATISYLPAEASHPTSFTRVCSANCDLCGRGLFGGSTSSGGGTNSSNVIKNGQGRAHSPFARHSRHSLTRRQAEWVSVEGDFAGIMLVIMPCRSDKSTAGVARYGHLSDGNIHLVLVRKCTRLQYFRFLLTMSSRGLEAGRHHGGGVEVIPAVAVRVEPGGTQESQWNVDGELLKCAAITAETHRGAIEVFARGVESSY